MSEIKRVDPELYSAVAGELKRQRDNLELIASENYTYPAVMEAQGSVLTNKYAEGYPQKRYYGGCHFVDIVEKLAVERAMRLFGAEHANVQPHSGTQANMAVYFSVLNPGDSIMGMHLSHGGHLSHGHPTSFSGKYFHTFPIGVTKKTETIDYKELKALAKRHRPNLIVAGSSSYSRVIDWKKFRDVADEVGAYLLADVAHYAGLIAAGIYPSPVPYADFVTMTSHKTLRGPRGGLILCRKKFAAMLDKTVFPGIQGGPLMHVIAAKAVALNEALKPGFKIYQKQILANSRRLASDLGKKGFRVVSGGTDCHMFLLDLTPWKMTGLDAERVLDCAGITVNKNSIPNDKEKPFITSGIRLGTPAVTARGMKEAEMDVISDLIANALRHRNNPSKIKKIFGEVRAFTRRFPLYRGM
jgi:glycine hydroxymethyltransferase